MTQVLHLTPAARFIWWMVVLFSFSCFSQVISLEQALEFARSRALSSKLAPVKLAQQDAQVDKVLGAYLPKASIEAVGTFNLPSISVQLPTSTVVIQPGQVLDIKANVSQPVINLKAWAALQGASTQTRALKASLEGDKRQLELETIRMYLAALRNKAQIKTQETRLERAQKQVSWLRQRQNIGQSSRSQLQRMEAEAESAALQLLEAQHLFENALSRLGVLIGIEEKFAIDEQAAIPQTECMRKDLEAAELSLKFSKQTLGVARSSLFPELNLSLQGIYTTNTNGFINQPLRGALLLQASWSIFDGGIHFAEIRESHAKIRQDQINLAHLKSQIDSEIRMAKNAVETRKTQLERAEKQLELRMKLYRELEQDTRSGLALVPDLIDANQKLTDAEIELETARLNQALSQAELGYVCMMGI